jgi:serine/threonine-protein kinase
MDSNFVQRFYQEARTIAALRHPNIVTVYEIGEAAGRLFIAMELAEGGTLEGKISDKGAMPWAAALSILRLIASALDYAHSQGVVHRDLKPANVLIGAESQPKLTDFGFARLLGGSNMTMASIASTIVGTPGYIAPEVWDANAATPAADIYALGCIAYELLTGIQLFIGATPVQALTAHVKGPQFPSQWPAGVPAGIERVLSKALAKDPDARHATGMALWEDLQSLSAPAPAPTAASAKAAPKAAPVKAAPAKAAPKAAPPVEEAPPAKGKPWLIPAIGGAVVVVILAIAGVVFGMGGGKGATPTTAPVAAAAAPTVNHTATAAAVSGAIATARAEGHQSAAQTIAAQATVTEAVESRKETSTAAAAPTATPKGVAASAPTATPKGAVAAAPTATPKSAAAAPTAAQATKGPSPTAGKRPTSTAAAATATAAPTAAAQGGAILASGRSGAIFTGTVSQGDPKDTSQNGTCIQGSVKPSGGGLFTHFFVQADQGGKTVQVEQYFYDSGNFKLCGLGAGEWGVAVYEYNKIPTSGQEQAAHQVRFRAAGTPGEIFYIKFVGKVDQPAAPTEAAPAATATPEAVPASTETPTP